MEDIKYKTYKTILLKGQIGDMAAQYMTEDDWIQHEKYINKLKNDGEYMKEYEVTLTMIDMPEFDKKRKSNGMESYRATFLNFR